VDNAFVRIESSQFIKGADTSEGHNDISIGDSGTGIVEFVCPRGTTGTPFKIEQGSLSVLELPPTKQVVSCK